MQQKKNGMNASGRLVASYTMEIAVADYNLTILRQEEDVWDSITYCPSANIITIGIRRFQLGRPSAKAKKHGKKTTAQD